MPTKESGALLHGNRDISNMYGWPLLKSKRLRKKNANKFLLGAGMDYQVKADADWDNAEILAEIVLDDPDDLRGTIKKMGLCKLYDAFRGKCRAGKCRRCGNNHELIKTGNSGISRHKTLHRFTNQAAKKVWKIAHNITRHYDGDARDIWKCRSPEDVQSVSAVSGLETTYPVWWWTDC